MKVIELTKGQVAIVDDEDFAELAQYRWCFWIYAQRGVTVSKGKRRMRLMHVQIMNPPPGMFVDHINGNKLDNRRCNLRLCTKSQNQANVPARKDNKLGVKGVFYHAKRRKFVAQITKDGKNKGLGYFDTAEEASAAYADAAKRLFGEFAKFN